MNILTPTEISECLTGGPTAVARAIEAAVLQKLAAGVSVEPDLQGGSFISTGRYQGGADGYSLEVLNTAIAAARVAALQHCCDCGEPYRRTACEGRQSYAPNCPARSIRTER